MNRANRPKTAGGLNFNLPNINKFKLSNGLQVYFIQKDKLPIVNISLILESGSKNDPEGQKGLAHLTSMLIDEGAGNMNALEIDSAFESLGSVFGVSTDKDFVYLSLLSLKENFENSLNIYSKIIGAPSFNGVDFNREKLKLKTKLLQSVDSASFIAEKVFGKFVFSGSNYSYPVIGRLEDVEQISNADVKQFYSNNFTVDGSVLVVVGNYENDEILGILEENLSDWRNSRSRKIFNNDLIGENNKIYLVHKEGSTQSELRIGHISTGRSAPDFYAKYLANLILGGQFSSRINLNLREDKGFTYGVNSNFQFLKNGASWEINTAVEQKHAGAALKEIHNEIEGVREMISQSELDFVKSSTIKKFPLMFETYSQVTKNLSLIPLFDLEDDYFNNYIKNIERTSLLETLDAAKANFHPEKLTYVVVGDRNILLDQLLKRNQEVFELDINGDPVSYDY